MADKKPTLEYQRRLIKPAAHRVTALDLVMWGIVALALGAAVFAYWLVARHAAF